MGSLWREVLATIHVSDDVAWTWVGVVEVLRTHILEIP